MRNLENLQKIKKVDLRTIEENDGLLTLIEINKEIPFEVRRIFFIYGVPSAMTIRGNHASENTEFFIQAIGGEAILELFDGEKTDVYQLTSLKQGVYIPRMTWIKLYGFTENTIVQVCASMEYKRCKYIDEFESYMKKIAVIVKNKKKFMRIRSNIW